MRSRNQGLRMVEASGTPKLEDFRTLALGHGSLNPLPRILSLGFRVWGLGFRTLGLGFEV